VKNRSKLPTISFVIPTLNCSSVLVSCLKSIAYQKYPSNLVEILIIDGGSTDDTIKVAQEFNCKIFQNPLKTGEAGKSIGVKKAIGKYVALIDSDNILPTSNWLKKMITPLEHNIFIVGSEPWKYTYRRSGGFIERYSALTGVNDPYTLTAGNYDRQGYLHKNWTGLKLPIQNFKSFQLATLQLGHFLPTIGANGTIYRRDFIKRYFHGDYFFDIDILSSSLDINHPSLLFAKVKVGIIHTFCESSISKFYRKQLRRAIDLYTFQPKRNYLLVKNNLSQTIKFIFYVCLIFPMLYDTFRGFIKKPDLAWLFHPVACVLTLYIYGLATIRHRLGLLKPYTRTNYSQ
jgi:glycosyltransferase involved in cell wall biosynthesis